MKLVPARRSPLRYDLLPVLLMAAVGIVSCEEDRAPETPARPPPARSLAPTAPAPRVPVRDPLAPPSAKKGPVVPRTVLTPTPEIGGGAQTQLVQSHHRAVYPGAPGRDLAAELRSRLGGLESCIVRAPTRTETTWEVDYNNPSLSRREVERRAPPPEPARSIRVSATFNTAGRVSSASVSVSPPIESSAQQCMQSRVEAIGLAPMQGRSTVEVTVGLAPRG